MRSDNCMAMRTRRVAPIALLAAALAVSVGAGTAAAKPGQAARPALQAAGGLSLLQALQNQYIAVVKRVAPAVVQIETDEGLGSGIVYDRKGHIITNAHVVGSATTFKVTFSNGRLYTGTLVGTFPTNDLAVIKIPATPAPAVFADSSKLQVGAIAMAVGNPLGLSSSVTEGIVSALGRTGQAGDGISLPNLIQTSAPINPGNSGGALVDLRGRVIGIPTLGASNPSFGGAPASGIGFAIPANMVRTVVAAVATGLKPVRPWLGASGQRVTAEIADTLGLAHPVGVLVDQVHPGGPADRAGVKAGDVIVAVDGLEVDDPQALRFRVATKPVGGTAALALMRHGKPVAARLPLAAPPETPPREMTEIKGAGPLSGAVIANMSPALAVELSMDTGLSGVVVVEIKGNSRAQRLRLRPGDVIVEVNDARVHDVGELRRALSQPAAGWKITVRRGDRVMTATLPG